MRTFFRTFFVLAVLISPLAIGCSSQQSEKDTPIQATDEGGTDSPVNDAENP